MWVLRTEEAAWLKAHPKMPKLKAGRATDALTDPGGLLEGMSELVEYRWAKGRAPEYASALPSDVDERGAPSAEPASEVAARKGLKDSYGLDLVSGQVPGAGSTIRPGRLLVVLEKEAPSESTSGGGGGSVYVPVPDGDDDDDVNVPGWLCPTRFC
jgi:hypothetical protein